MLFVIILGVFLPIVTLIIGAKWGRSYERSLWQEQLLRRSIRLSDADHPGAGFGADASTPAESAHLGQAVEAIAAEVERLGEGQRFLTRLLAERDPRGEKTSPASPDAAPESRPPTT